MGMDNALQTTTVGASVNQLFDSEAQEAMERQFQVLASIGAHATHLARLFVLQYPENSMWLTQSHFWSLCFDFKRPRLPVKQQPNYRDPDENLFFVAIDPNHSNLCGWTAGSFRNSAHVFERSRLLLNPKERRLNHPPPLTQATPNTYSAQSFQEYLIEISLSYVPESEEEPEYASIMSGNLQRGERKKVRRNNCSNSSLIGVRAARYNKELFVQTHFHRSPYNFGLNDEHNGSVYCSETTPSRLQLAIFDY
ncbi:hypothetical protein P9112_001093 [Eukaryota sp. TZLM1-RC]